MSAPFLDHTLVRRFQDLSNRDQYRTNEECPVCLQSIEEQKKWGHVAIAPGSEGVNAFFHSYCESCLKKWSDAQKQKHLPLNCPVCKVELRGMKETEAASVARTSMERLEQSVENDRVQARNAARQQYCARHPDQTQIRIMSLASQLDPQPHPAPADHSFSHITREIINAFGGSVVV